MDSKKSPKGRKRTAKTSAAVPLGASVEDNFWDCSVCTFRNNAEAFKCSMCGVGKGTSTRKPRLNPDLVAQQQAQALTPPPITGPVPSSSGIKSPVSPSESVGSGIGGDEEETDLAALASLKGTKRVAKDKVKKKEPKKTVNKARLKNVDRSSATYHSVTVNDFTVVITEFKPKVKKEKKDKSESNGRSPSNEDDDSNSDSRGGGGGGGGSAGSNGPPEPPPPLSGDNKPPQPPSAPSSGGPSTPKSAPTQGSTFSNTPIAIPLKAANGSTSTMPAALSAITPPAKDMPNKLSDLKENTTRSS